MPVMNGWTSSRTRRISEESGIARLYTPGRATEEDISMAEHSRRAMSSEIVRALSGVEPAQERCYEVRRVILHESLEAPEVTCHPAAHQPERGGESFEPASRLERDPHPNDGPRESDG